MRPVLVMGRHGLLAQAICRRNSRRNPLSFWGRRDLPATILEQMNKIYQLRPSAIINAAGSTNLRLMETSSSSGFDLNVQLPSFLAVLCRTMNIPFVTISSDYVFSGRSRSPSVESDSPEPLNAYGRSKLQGERAVLSLYPRSKIIRTAGLFGHASPGGKVSFPERILNQIKLGQLPEVREDLTTSICHIDDLADELLNILWNCSGGIYHVANAGEGTWLEIAEYALKIAGAKTKLKPTRKQDFPRPRYSVLATTRSEISHGVSWRKSWQSRLGEFIKELCEQ